MSQDTFCVNPWVSLHAKMLDGFNPCCLFKGTVKSDTIDNYVHSTELSSIKQRLLNNEQIPECSACWQQEKNGYTSKRQRDNNSYGKIFQLLNRDISAPHGKFVEYYVRLGNHCNIRCTSCNDKYSSGWISENKKFNILTKPAVLLADDSDVWQHLRNNASTIRAIEFIGGEPFMMSVETQANLLQWLVENDHAKHIRIKYNTNGTRLPTEQLKYWGKFKAIELNVSVDGVGDRFEYLRFPAEWALVDTNIKYYQELQKTIPCLEVTLINTISVLSVGYVHEVISYCEQNNLKLFLNMLENPEPLNVFLSCAEVKNWISAQLQHIDHPVIKTVFDNLQNQKSTVSAQQLVDFLAPLDQRRKLDLRNTFPELAQCLQSATFPQLI